MDDAPDMDEGSEGAVEVSALQNFLCGSIGCDSFQFMSVFVALFFLAWNTALLAKFTPLVERCAATTCRAQLQGMNPHIMVALLCQASFHAVGIFIPYSIGGIVVLLPAMIPYFIIISKFVRIRYCGYRPPGRHMQQHAEDLARDHPGVPERDLLMAVASSVSCNRGHALILGASADNSEDPTGTAQCEVCSVESPTAELYSCKACAFNLCLGCHSSKENENFDGLKAPDEPMPVEVHLDGGLLASEPPPYAAPPSAAPVVVVQPVVWPAAVNGPTPAGAAAPPAPAAPAAAAAAAAPAAAAAAASAAHDPNDNPVVRELLSLAKLHREGGLTDVEFDLAKRRTLGLC